MWNKLLLTLFFILSGVSYVQAHSWYSKKTDPVTKQSCCGGSDCNVLKIDPTVLSAEDEGYRVRLTVEQARTINPYTSHPINALVYWERVQLSEDGNYHICIKTHSRGGYEQGVYCLFVPPST